MFPAFLTTIFFSLSAVSGNRCARTFGGLEANFWRLVIAASLLACYVFIFGQSLSGPVASAFVLSGFVGIGAGDMLFFQALPRIGSRLTVLIIQCLSVPFAATVEWIWLGTALSARQMLWSSVVMTGICLALFPIKRIGASRKEKIIGLAVAVLAAIGNGFGAVLSRKAYQLAQESGQNVSGATAAYQRVLGGLLVAGIAILIFRWPVIRDHLRGKTFFFTKSYTEKWRRMWLWIATTSLAGQTLGVTCFQWALKNHPTGIVLPIVAMTPLITMPFAWKLEGEKPTFRSTVGAVVAVFGVIALLYWK